jgi:catechol 1,2-dioxygenase
MIVTTPQQLTHQVLAEMARAGDPRQRELLTALTRHLHAFATEVQLTEGEFQQACALVARLGALTTPAHNEVVLCAGSLGLSALVCLLNNGTEDGTHGERGPTTANLLGPFWRDGSPPTPNGGSIVRSPTPGAPVFVSARVEDAAGTPIEGAEVDVWHASADGYYENQDPGQADMNLRGRFVTDALGTIRLRTIKPVGYPIPVHGVVGDLLRTLGRHNMRPAHLHFLIHKPGFKTQFSQLYSHDDPNLETDVQFGVTRALIAHYVHHGSGEPAPDADVTGAWYSLEHRFEIQPGTAQRPRAPISAKADGARPAWTKLERRDA